MRPLLALPTALLLLGGVSRAADLRLVSDTHLRSFPRPGLDEPSEHHAFYELVRLRTRDTGLAGVSIEASVWGRIEAGDLYRDEERVSGDVNLLLLRYRAPRKSLLSGLELLLGRQFVPVGPSMLEQLDGARATYRLPLGLTASAFAGAVSGLRFIRQPWPIEDDEREYGGNWTTGARLGYQLDHRLQLGAGYRLRQHGGETAFSELNWDGLLAPFDWLELFSDGVVELTSQRLKQARASTRLRLRHDLMASVGYRYVSPDLFIPRTSIFAVFSDETFQEGFVESEWRLRRWLRLRGELAGLVYGESCVDGALGGDQPRCDDVEAHLRALARTDVSFGFGGRHRATLELERRGAPEGGYWRWRLAGSLQARQTLSVVLDLDWLWLDESDDGAVRTRADEQRWGLSGATYLAWQLRDDLSLLGGGQVWTSPLFHVAGSLMVRLSWVIDSQAGAWGPVEIKRSPAGAVALGGAS